MKTVHDNKGATMQAPDLQNLFATRRRFFKTVGGGVLLGALPTLAYAAKDDMLAQQQVNLIDMASKQRILVQRCAKLYAQSLVGARASDAKRLTTDSIARFDVIYAKHSAAAETAGSTNYQTAKVLQTIGQDWPKLRAIFQKAPNEKYLAEMVAQSESLSKLINQSTGPTDMFLSRSPIGKLLAISGKQCFISQRLAGYYFLRTLKFNPDEANRVIADTVKDFEYNAEQLAKGAENTTEIKFLIQLGGTQWPYFKDAIATQNRSDGSQLDYNVATTAENMLEVLERTNLLYYQLATN